MKTIEDYFMSLVQIDSESKNEKEIALRLEEDLLRLGAEVKFDQSNSITGSNVGNLYAYFPGEIKKDPILFCAHMDTVKPGNGVKPSIKGDKIVTDGTTILGADDKSGIAEIIWAVKLLKEKKISHAPIEILFTVCEEIGLLGAKGTNYDMIKSKIGYALDSHEVGSITVGAPTQNSIKICVHGKESHAGVEPEKGVSAIQIAADAISNLHLGRINDQTTCNIGTINGGEASNIIPNKVEMVAEVRSHEKSQIDEVTNKMKIAFDKAAIDFKTNTFTPTIDFHVETEYENFLLQENEDVVKIAEYASQKLDLPFDKEVGGGGSDANIFNANGLRIAIAGTGMDGYHTVNESISLQDLRNGANWIIEVIKTYSE